MLIKYCWHSVGWSQSVSQSVSRGSRAVTLSAKWQLQMWRRLSKSLNWAGGEGVWKKYSLSHSYLSSCFHTQLFGLLCWAICKLAENFCFVFSALTSYKHIIHSCIRCENKFNSLTHWQLVLNLQITCVYLGRPLLLMTALELFKNLKDLKLNSLWSCLKTFNAIGNLINMMKLKKWMLFIGLSVVMFLLMMILLLLSCEVYFS